MATFFEAIGRHAKRHPEREALISAKCRISYGEMPGIIEKYEHCLVKAGISANSVVGLEVRDEIAHLLMSLALLKMSAGQATIGYHDSKNYRENLIQRLSISDVVSIDDRFDPSLPAPRYIEVTRRPDVIVSGRANKKNDDPIIYAATSGTTGLPRIVPRSEQIFIQLAERYIQPYITSRPERRLWLEGPLQNMLISTSVEYHNVKATRLRWICVGLTSVFVGKEMRDTEDFLNLIKQERVGVFNMSIPEAEMVVAGGRQIDSLKETMIEHGALAQVAGVRIPWILRKAILENFCDKLYVAYGATEALRVSIAGPGDHNERECVGRPLPQVNVEIVDEEGKVLPPNEVGDIRIRAPGMVTSYFDDPEETAKRFRDGWFYPGDMASLAEDGQLIVHGRKDDMMNLNSIKIYPAEIERVFETHPEVAAAAAFPIKSKIHGDIPAVALELVKGSRLGEQDLMQYAREKLGLRSPRRAIILDALPRNAIGKVQKTELAVLAKQRDGENG